jgi:hypothetical protein
MKLWFVLLWCVFGSVWAVDAPAQPVAAEKPAQPAQPPQPNAVELIAASDAVRNPGRPFRMDATLVEYVRGSERSRVGLAIFVKRSAETRQFRNLVRYTAPPRDAGKIILLGTGSLWFYDPTSKASVRISPQQRLIGQAADGDVLTVNLSRDYSPKIVGRETIQDSARTPHDCWHIELSASTDEAIYRRVEYWVEQSTSRPIKGKFYSDSGRLLKVAYYGRYQSELGSVRPTETILIDAVDTGLVTTIRYANFRETETPDFWFQREFLPRLPIE